MQYLGGKAKIAKPLGEYLRKRQGSLYAVEPFCGALNVTAQLTGPRIACDASPYLFSLYKAVREGWDPPDAVTEEDYKKASANRDPENPLTAFIGYGCSFGGKFFGGYARCHARARASYAASARNSLKRKIALCTQATFSHCSYERLTAGAGHFVYCDPPYANTTGYSAVGAFDSNAFWQRAREWGASGALVLVSEYVAPADFMEVWKVETKTAMGGLARVERLFEAPR